VFKNSIVHLVKLLEGEGFFCFLRKRQCGSCLSMIQGSWWQHCACRILQRFMQAISPPAHALYLQIMRRAWNAHETHAFMQALPSPPATAASAAKVGGVVETTSDVYLHLLPLQHRVSSLAATILCRFQWSFAHLCSCQDHQCKLCQSGHLPSPSHS